MSFCGDGIRVVHPLFPAEGDGAIPISPLQLRIGWTTVKTAVQLNALWHSRLPAFTSPEGHCKAICAEHAGRFYAAAIWSLPSARMLNNTGRYELRRFAIAPDAPPNTASRMLRIMRKMIFDSMPDVKILISYQDTEVHFGTIYKAAGWSAVATGGGGEWSRPSRTRKKVQSSAPKTRWELRIRPEKTKALIGNDGRECTCPHNDKPSTHVPACMP